MARQRKIDRYPELRQALSDMRSRGEVLDGAHEFVRQWLKDNAPGESISERSVSRYLGRIDEVAERSAHVREAAEILMRPFGEGEDQAVARAVNELMEGLLFEKVVKGELSVSELQKLAQARRDLATAQKSSVEVIERARKAAREDAAQSAEKEAKRRGLSPDVASAIRAAIQGTAEA